MFLLIDVGPTWGAREECKNSCYKANVRISKWLHMKFYMHLDLCMNIKDLIGIIM